MFEIDTEKVSSKLEMISENYPPDSDEYKTLQLAGLALHFVSDEQTRDKFRRWCELMNGGLSDAQKEHLRFMGIDPEPGNAL
jgi:hypothetical protein